MEVQLGANIALATRLQDEVRAAGVEAAAEKEVDTSPEDREPAIPVESRPAETEELPGVVRLLKQGHFKGVADLRLRIVHADKIAALESERLRADVTDISESLTSSISSTVAELAEAPDSIGAEQADAAVVAFEDQISVAIDTSFASGAFEPEEIETTLQSAFQTLVDQLELGSKADDLTPEGIEFAIGSDALANEADKARRDFLAELREIFSVELSNILALAQSEMTLPPVSEPNGNGRAFDKFLAIYNTIQDSGDIMEESSIIEIDV